MCRISRKEAAMTPEAQRASSDGMGGYGAVCVD
jgi:hypothetical protein